MANLILLCHHLRCVNPVLRRFKLVFALSKIELTSPAFEQLGRIPFKHTGEGEDISPALAWTEVPEGTRSFVIACHDPDAPMISGASYGFVHWVVYNVPASVRSFPEGFSGYTEGSNSFGRTTYGGPMPPPNHGTHLYYFWVFALDAELNLEPGLSLWQVLEKIEQHTLGMNRLVGTYSRG